MKQSKEFWHTLTPGLVEVLRKFGLRVKSLDKNKIHIRKDLDLDISENNNFQKLKYWGLVAKYRENGKHIAGFWVLTRNGGAFLRNELDMPKKVKTFENHLIEKSQERTRITDFFNCYGEEYWQQTFIGLPIENEQKELFLKVGSQILTIKNGRRI